ncbi:hypothetical protein ABT097_28050 [Streptomyces sp. NPDC002225]|uniref:NucA/NucB deoxyribonuclease domain-containing protein n=1 Tax=Streptomyces sp. NPDC002225 TaxID=3154413 RepID=UPI00331CBDC1
MSYMLPLGANGRGPDGFAGEQSPVRLSSLSQQRQAVASRMAAETVGPARAWAPVSRVPSGAAPLVGSSAVASAAAGATKVTWPDPSRTMTAAECRKGLGTDKAFFVKSRFAVCSGAVFLQTWLQNKRPVGQTQFVVLSVGTIAAKSREISFQYHFTDMAKTGSVKTGGLLIKTSPKIPKKWPGTAKVTQGGNVPGSKSFDELARTKTFKHTVKVASKQGTGPDDTVFAVYEPVISITPPPGYTLNGAGGKLFMLAPRWDKASYVSRDDGAAAFSYLPTLTYSSKKGAPEKAVADHIKKAYSSPGATKPVNSAKKIPGQSASDPLNRLFRDTDRRKKNRSEAIKVCEKYWGKKYSKNNTYQCDEFPFATTYQGAAESQFEAAAPKNNFSAMPLVTAENRDAGILLGQFMTKNRIIDGTNDGFIVKIK